MIEPLMADGESWNITFHTFLGLDSVIYCAVNGTAIIQDILNCVPKTNEAFTGLERYGGK